ncbi:MAG: DNA-processing protein DprA [Clostridia bacterium]|nr:DNA-processing protein DprA [Clostridia bacterium]
MTVAVVGSRDTEKDYTDEIIGNIPSGCTKIVSGGAVGIDSCAQQAAKRLGIDFLAILPDYDKYGKSAPIVRNCEIIESADYVIGFWDYSSAGTKFVIKECLKRNKPIKIIKI